MADAPKLKDYFTTDVVRSIGERLATHHPSFDVDRFVDLVLAPPGGEPFGELEFTARSRRIADALEAVAELEPLALFDLLTASLPAELDDTDSTLNDGFMLWPWGEVISRHGADHVEAGLAACYELTKRFTSEFAIRPILAEHPDTLTTLAAWSTDPNEHVRRLVSEGTRPRLPWAKRLPLPLDPVLEILTTLRADPSLYVRKSVANHLNDLAKDHPERIIEMLADWHTEDHEHTNWIVRHALRNHLKDGTPAALEIFGYAAPKVDLADLTAAPATVPIGDPITASFELRSTTMKPQLLMIDIVMGYQKANGSTSPKVFKFRELTLDGGETLQLEKSFDMVIRSTRKLYPGEHTVTIRINGVDLANAAFELTK